MTFAQVSIVVLVAVATVIAEPGHGHHGAAHREIHHSQDGHAHKFGYHIADHLTGDLHGREEVGHGGHKVAGNYHLLDPYGYIRSVDYVAGHHGGTHQVVHGSPYGLYVHSPYFSIVPKGKHY